MRLIDADAIEKKLDEERKWLVEQNMKGAENILVHYLMRNLWEAPTIDVVPVVRCKDCKHRAEWNGAYGCDLDGCYGDRYTDGFCDRAERKDDE